MLQELLKGVRGRDRQRLERLTHNVDSLDWNHVKCQEDMISYLFQGQTTDVSSLRVSCTEDGQFRLLRYDPESVIATKEQMEQFIDDHQLKLQYHPRFAAVYDQQNNNLPVASTSHCTTEPLIATSGKQIGYPPCDWDIINKKLGTSDQIGKRLICDDIAAKLTRTCRKIIHHYNPKTSDTPNDITQVVNDVVVMDKIATDISVAPTSELRYAMHIPLLILRDCMSAICTQLAKSPLAFLTETLGEEQLKMVLHKVSMIDAIMKKMSPRSGVESEIEKIKHMF
jgi:hypothetical protein